MPTSPQKIFLGILGLLTLAAADVQAQVAPEKQSKSASRFDKPQHKHKGQLTDAMRGIKATVVRPGQSVNYFWDTNTSRWVVYRKQENTYDSGARVTQEVYRDSATSALDTRYLYTYDARGNQTSYTYQTWNNNAWVNQYRSLMTYDARGNETEYLSQMWNGTAWGTDGGSQNVYTYNAAGVITESISKDWEDGVFVNEDREVYTLVNGQWSAVLLQSWENGAWVTEGRIMDIVWYDWAALKPASYKEQELIGTTFVDEERSTLSYASNGSRTTTVEAYTGSAWVPDYRFADNYDNFGNYLGYTEEEWTNNAWRLSYGFRSQLFYNASNVVLRKVDQDFDNASRQWRNNSRSNYSNFQNITLASARNAALEAQSELYPNPASSMVTLEVAGLAKTEAASGEVRNALGQLVQSFTARPQGGKLSTQLDLSTLQSGIYTVRLQTGDGTVVKRVVRN
ncbi:T9SS type A sorting domain-containing protein [Hymenobacter sp. BT635]|uniref:T9SS type A sorting domain-containing protein n=1 Tax=Hymenobacter nitidus TaxID=2880929 RepID=A0ABS8AHI3_9BACT|nr:T9SS type A sorting domain-containing protein [Hymenobacter nitidus]MCB2378919.1 T9SS type A sorting domain-containing protein [Hymenobacter nitidus]